MRVRKNTRNFINYYNVCLLMFLSFVSYYLTQNIFFSFSLIIFIGSSIVLWNYYIIKRVKGFYKDVNEIIVDKGLSKSGIYENSSNKDLEGLKGKIQILLDEIRKESINRNEDQVKYKNILNSMTNGFVYLEIVEGEDGTSIDGKILEINDATKEMLGIRNKDVVGEYISNVYENFEKCEDTLLDIFDEINKHRDKCIEIEVNLIKNIWVMASFNSNKNGYVSIILNDISEMKRYSEDMSLMANYDSLTKLLNRHTLINYIGELQKEDAEFSILFIDLDNFKTINDTLGHSSGDRILCIVAEVLNEISRGNITVGRLGGDEFIVVRKGVNNDEVDKLAEEILHKLNKTFDFDDFIFELKASIGISSHPQGAKDINILLQYADISMYKAKELGGNTYVKFDDSMLDGIVLQNRLQVAIEKGELEVYYQPIYDLVENRITGAEALIRWITDDGMVFPDQFIPIAKRNGYIKEIDDFVLENACKYYREWKNEGVYDFMVSVNISHRYLKHSKFIERVKELVEKYGVLKNGLKFEITEDEIIDDPDYVIKILNQLRELGVRVALDDFGIGYSSFNYIKTLPLDIIKIDRSLISSLEEDHKTLYIIETIIKLCHSLELEVICEGIELKSQMNLLQKLRCDKIQGYYISKPVCREEFAKLIEKYNY